MTCSTLRTPPPERRLPLSNPSPLGLLPPNLQEQHAVRAINVFLIDCHPEMQRRLRCLPSPLSPHSSTESHNDVNSASLLCMSIQRPRRGPGATISAPSFVVCMHGQHLALIPRTLISHNV